MKLSRLIVFILLVVMVVIGGGTWLSSRNKAGQTAIDTTDQPTIGDPHALVQVVVFEEPRCSDCRVYHHTVFPQLKEEFIDSKKIIYTVIPVAFLPGSLPGAVALLCVYNQDPGFPNGDLFMRFLDNLLQNNWETQDQILELAAKTSPSIDLSKLQQCIHQATYEKQINTNLAFARDLQKETFSVPSVYVNGKRVLPVDYSHIQEAIVRELNH